jgi:adenine C2-methylase RlmN of 23S rRNA A2503 and tRNA A37
VAVDGNKIESVMMKNSSGRWTVCLSAQVGCPIGCIFCATGQDGFKRNLTSEEISDQVLFWQNYLKKNLKDAKVDSLVFMGMGEPFLNWENVKGAIKDLIDPELFGLGARCVSVSTIGIPTGIKKLAKDFPQVNLAVSIHSANEKKRAVLVPVSHEYNLVKLRQAIDNYLNLTNRKVFIEYVLLAGVNDNKEDARELAEYLKTFTKPYLLHVNLISYNKTKADFQPLTAEQAERFKNELSRNKISVTIRKSLGKEIEGACGQLAGK